MLGCVGAGPLDAALIVTSPLSGVHVYDMQMLKTPPLFKLTSDTCSGCVLPYG